MKLSEYIDGGVPPLIKQGDTKPVALNEAVRRVIEKYPEIDVEEPDQDIPELLAWLEQCRRANDWTGVKWRHAALAARALFQPPYSEWKRWTALRLLMFDTLTRGDKRSFARASLSAYLLGFDPRSSLTKSVARALKANWQKTLPQISDIVEEFELFKVGGLERRIGAYLHRQENPFRALKDLGVSSPHMPGLFQRSYRDFIDRKKPTIKNGNRNSIEQVLRWLKPNSEDVLRNGHEYAVCALLLPWAESSPPDDIQTIIRSELVDAYGDPRLGSGDWHSVPEKARQIIRRWLTGASLMQFLEIVSAVEGSHMWDPRRRFWEEKYAQGMIDEAWVVLSWQGAEKATELAKLYEDAGYRSHGISDNVRSDPTCFLLLRSGDATIVEGSHNFSIRFYRRSNDYRPSLYQERYSRHSFQRQIADDFVPHMSNWERRANMKIAQYR